MKENIKQILREGMDKNTLGVVISRPTQELIIMRGIPGAGKSTKAKTLVGEGIIHSTDSIIERSGDYREFFAKMVETKNFMALGRAHSKNLKESIESMKAGISPVIIDNTNIKHNEAKGYVMAALELGYSDQNIKFVDVGTGGLVAEGLAARNTHGVPLDKIKQMIASHASQGDMTLERVVKAKDMYKTSDILYSAVVLDKASQNKLLTPANYNVEPPDGWVLGQNAKHFCDHMTIAFGKGVKDKKDLGKEVTLKVTKVGLSDMAMAFQVEGYPSDNVIPHITLAVNPDGGKPVMSNDITKWQDIKPFFVTGVVTEIKK